MKKRATVALISLMGSLQFPKLVQSEQAIPIGFLQHLEQFEEEADNLDHITYNSESEVPEKVLELDLQIRPAETSKRFLTLYEMDDDEGVEDNTAINGQGFLEKNLADFFDIQIFSTVYFGSQHEPHQLIFDTGSSWLWVQTPYCDSCYRKDPFIHRFSNTFSVEPDFDIFQINVSFLGVMRNH